MQIHLLTDHRIRLTTHGEGFSFETGDAASLSPFHLLAASLATCTHAVLHGYGSRADIPVQGLAIDVAWELGGDPYRVTRMEMALEWPGLPDDRREAARRAAAHCTVHHTLEHGSTVETRVAPSEAGAPEERSTAEPGEA